MLLNLIFVPESVSVANTGCNIVPTRHNKLKMSVTDDCVFSLECTLYFRHVTCNSFQLHVSCAVLNINETVNTVISILT